MTALHVGDVVEWDTFAGSVVEVERGRVIAVTPTEVRTMCHRARWRGRGAGTYYTVECCWQLAELDRLRKVGLPTPSTSATIDHTAPGLGKVTVAGYYPELVDYEPVEYAPRPKAKCARCGIEGHIASNQRFHPDPERLDRAALLRARPTPQPADIAVEDHW